MSKIVERDEVLGVVRNRLSRNKRFPVEIDEEYIRREDDWWFIPVWPRKRKYSNVEYFGILAEIEIELGEEGMNVLFVPVEPPEDEPVEPSK